MPVTTHRSYLRRASALAAGVAILGGAAATAFPASASAAGKSVTIKVEKNKTWGNILELGNGQTVYRLDSDPTGKSSCTGACAKVWPPVLASKVNAKGLKGFTEIKRAGGQKQVAFKGHALYTFIADKTAGQVKGNVKDSWGQWATVNPAHPTATPVAKKAASSGGASTAPPTTAASSSAGF